MTRANATDLDVLVVGAGPTGLTLAAQLVRFGVRFRIVDKQIDRAHESRALAVQARSLEVLQTVGLGDELVSRGRTTTQLMLHVDQGEPPTIDLGDIGRTDTRFPFILFVGQTETEAALTTHLTSNGVVLERGIELIFAQQDENGLVCTLRNPDGREESIGVKYLVGCDGAHSTVRKLARIPFEGGAYPQQFALGDVEADGISSGAIHAFAAGHGMAMFFPLGHPTTWRVMAMDPGGSPNAMPPGNQEVATHALSLAELQAMIQTPTYNSVRLRDAQWLTRFSLHHRQATRYREGRTFLAGDAAHIHSPVGAQGMNTGIQDAWNLGWKLGMFVNGRADESILDTYNDERWPVGRTLLRATDRLFGMFAKSLAGSEMFTRIRRIVVRRIVAPALSRSAVRRTAFHFVSQLGIHYRANQLVTEGEPRLQRGPKAGERLPDMPLRQGTATTYLQQQVASPHIHLLLCGPVAAWDAPAVDALVERFSVLKATHLTRDDSEVDLVDANGEALNRLGIEHTGQYIVRPDGHIGYRCAETSLQGAADYLDRSFRCKPS